MFILPLLYSIKLHIVRFYSRAESLMSRYGVRRPLKARVKIDQQQLSESTQQ